MSAPLVQRVHRAAILGSTGPQSITPRSAHRAAEVVHTMLAVLVVRSSTGRGTRAALAALTTQTPTVLPAVAGRLDLTGPVLPVPA
jgi:hypothetical protein